MDNTNYTNENVSLLKRISARLHNPKIAKSILGLTLAGVLALSSTACDLYTNPPHAETESSTQSSVNNETNNNHETNNNGTDNNQTNNNSGSTQYPVNPNLSKYSPLLQSILTNEEYNELIKLAHNTNPKLLQTGEFEPHPYAFLEEEGFDIEAIKKGDDLCRTVSYVLTDDKNSLYMHTQVDCGDYYETFLLKYQLTEQEMQDYHLTHTGGGNVNVPYYVQCVFMNREIAATRDPEVVGTSKMAKESHESLKKSMGGNKYGIETGTCNIIFINPNSETNKFDLILYPRNTNSYGISCTSTIVDLDCYSTKTLYIPVCTEPSSNNELLVLNKTSANAILYFTQDENLEYLSNRNLNWEHMN